VTSVSRQTRNAERGGLHNCRTPTKGNRHRRTSLNTTTMSLFPSPKPLQPQESGLIPAAVLDRVLQAETQAIQEKADENAMSARIVLHLLRQLNERRDILGDQPCTRVINEIVPSLQHDDNNLIFELGQRYRDHLIRTCTFSYFSVLFGNVVVILKLGCPLWSTTHPPQIVPLLLPTTR
jgi:hypothetical protein